MSTSSARLAALAAVILPHFHALAQPTCRFQETVFRDGRPVATERIPYEEPVVLLDTTDYSPGEGDAHAGGRSRTSTRYFLREDGSLLVAYVRQVRHFQADGEHIIRTTEYMVDNDAAEALSMWEVAQTVELHMGRRGLCEVAQSAAHALIRFEPEPTTA